jgi:O-antigen biosynthesis protein WbqV
MSRAGAKGASGWTPWLVYAHDLAWAALVMGGAILLRYHFEPKPLPKMMVVQAVTTYTLVCAVVFLAFRQHRSMWRFTALNDILRIGQAVVVADLLLLPILFLINRAQDFPRSAIAIATPVLILGLGFGRVLAHALAHGDLGAVFRFEDRSRPAAVVVGSAQSAAAYLSALRRDSAPPFRIAGIVALDGAPHGRIIQGVEVLGALRNLAPVLKSLAAGEDREPQVVLAEARPGRELINAVIAAAAEAGAKLVRVRGEQGGAGLAPVQAADLLDRPPRTLDRERARALIGGRRVLVTGAGGTIGGELTRRALTLDPARLVLLDASEFNLYAIDHELKETDAPPVWTAELGDIRDVPRLATLFERERPDVVLHAAALKHVPLMETHPAEAVLTNVGGAINVARLARRHGADLVFISTDKAVNPTNVMGATKRVAERAVEALSRGGQTNVAIVRFGNVLGSAGSVVPLFERQIAQGGPVTVTHPDMVRYFMTVQEAASLVLQAAALPRTGDASGNGHVFVLDMGEPVRIDDLARQLIRLHGLTPGEDIDIAYTGLRPGEKLYEEIFYDAEKVRPTAAEGVLAAYDPAPDWSELERPIEALLRAATARDEGAVLELLKTLEPAFRPG